VAGLVDRGMLSRDRAAQKDGAEQIQLSEAGWTAQGEQR
jgi:hypothetical protein